MLLSAAFFVWTLSEYTNFKEEHCSKVLKWKIGRSSVRVEAEILTNKIFEQVNEQVRSAGKMQQMKLVSCQIS